MSTSQPPRRYHAFDSLRAYMMLLGLVLHTALSYTTGNPNDMGLPYRDAQTSSFFDWLIAFIHIFRMPTFFVMSGFFAALLYERRGAKTFLRHRIDRLGVPLLVGWPCLGLMLAGAMYFAELYTTKFVVVKPVGNFLLHLWFLYDLLIFCFVAVPIMWLIRRMPRAIKDRILDLFGHSVNRIHGLVLFAAISALPLYQMESFTIDHSGHPLRPPHILLNYAVFFVFGWLLYNRREVVDRFKNTGWLYLGLGIGCYVLYQCLTVQTANVWHLIETLNFKILGEILAQQAATATTSAKNAMATCCLSLSIWCLVHGFLGVFLRYLDHPSPRWRYLTDASYWMYLIHLPIATVMPTLFTAVAWPVGIKFTLALSLLTSVCLLTYRYWVRETFIGQTLNGRRYPRAAQASY